MNEHILVGNLGKDPEVRFTQSGAAVTSLNVGCNRTYYNQQTGERQQLTDWVKVVAFGTLAESAGDGLQKGDKVIVVGRQNTRSYDDKNGEKRYVTETVATHIGVLLTAHKSKKSVSDMGTEVDEEIPF